MYSIGSVIDRMSKTQVILGAKKVQLISNIERLSTVLMQTQIARGRIFDADVASEASRLAKQQILAGAASEMISLATTEKFSRCGLTSADELSFLLLSSAAACTVARENAR